LFDYNEPCKIEGCQNHEGDYLTDIIPTHLSPLGLEAPPAPILPMPMRLTDDQERNRADERDQRRA
jgi:hypothetical protein